MKSGNGKLSQKAKNQGGKTKKAGKYEPPIELEGEWEKDYFLGRKGK
jgi:hypothetical protein